MTRHPMDPNRKPPPVEARPKCAGCGKRLRPAIYGGHSGQSRYWSGHYDSYGAFCTLRCGTAFANFTARRVSNGGSVRSNHVHTPNLYTRSGP